MCGIFGITLKKDVKSQAPQIIVEGLRALEYRGYDSVGIAVIQDDGQLDIRKGKGSLSAVSLKLKFHEMKGRCGIGHTRWATHGPPTDTNAHPHTDCNKKIAVVHNGIIKNYLPVKKKLIEHNHIFESETDTEVIPHLVEEYYNSTGDFFKAFSKAVSSLEGSYAIALITAHEPEKIFFAKKESPLIIGVMDKGMILASDIPAILSHTNRIVVITEGEYGWVSPDSIYIEKKGVPTFSKERIAIIEWKAEMARKGGYPHYMIKEIHEQPIALKTTYEGLLSDDDLLIAAEAINNADRVFVAAAGTSFHAGLVTKYFVENLAGILVYPFISSEYKSVERIIGENDVLIAISQSGETIDTLKAIRTFRDKGGKVVAVTNVLGSAINRESDYTITMRAGPEIGVAATKTFLTQVLTGSILAVQLGELTGELTTEEAKKYMKDLEKAPKTTGDSIALSEKKAKSLSSRIMGKHSAYFLGRGLGVPLALEGALKMKEISYIHAEAYPAGESKHGPIAIVEEDYPVLVLATTDTVEEIKNNVAEMNARDALTVAISPINYSDMLGAKVTVPVPKSPLILQPYALTPPFQLLAYYTAVRLGYNPDKPRNLAKTVTVE